MDCFIVAFAGHIIVTVYEEMYKNCRFSEPNLLQESLTHCVQCITTQRLQPYFQFCFISDSPLPPLNISAGRTLWGPKLSSMDAVTANLNRPLCSSEKHNRRLCYRSSHTENRKALISTVNFGSTMRLHMGDRALCQFAILKKKYEPFNYMKHKYGTSICWYYPQPDYLLESSHWTDAQSHIALLTSGQERINES